MRRRGRERKWHPSQPLHLTAALPKKRLLAHWGNGGRDAPNPKPQDRLPAELRTREEKEK